MTIGIKWLRAGAGVCRDSVILSQTLAVLLWKSLESLHVREGLESCNILKLVAVDLMSHQG